MLDRPLSNGSLSRQIEAKLSRGAAIVGPKLVVLAGSNGPYSHRCETIEPIVGLPCVNAGVAVGIGLDYLFARWEPLLRAGDVVYLPMEPTQYSRGRVENTLGPDAAILFRHDWQTLAALAPDRWLGAAFSSDLRAAVMSVVETSLSVLAPHGLRLADASEINAWGDHIGHTEALAMASRGVLAAMHPVFPGANEIARGYGSERIASFTERATARGVIVIGGLSTGFIDAALTEAQIAAISEIYSTHGGQFLILDNRSRYPREMFFDSAAHLNEAAQIIHSHRVGVALRAILGLPVADQVMAGAASAAIVTPR